MTPLYRGLLGWALTGAFVMALATAVPGLLI